jgi:hypothetical protein
MLNANPLCFISCPHAGRIPTGLDVVGILLGNFSILEWMAREGEAGGHSDRSSGEREKGFSLTIINDCPIEYFSCLPVLPSLALSGFLLL